MIAIPGSRHHWCDGIARREFLQIGGLGAAGLALPELLRARAQASTPAARGAGRAKACILLFMGGGPPQMDTFDLKPDAPAEVRGEFPPIATSVPGTQISSLLPMLAQQAHRYAIIRTVSDEYTGGAHGQSVYLALTGHKNPRVSGDDIRPATDDYPNMGSAVARLRGAGHALPPHVWLLDMHRRSFAGEGGGFLGQTCDPFRILQDPNRPDFRVQALTPPREVPLDRFGARRGLLEQIQRHGDHVLGRRMMDAHQERAFNMILAPQTQTAFDLNAEPMQVRDRYGRHKFGQGVLLARRLVEQGVPLVTVYWNGEEVPGGWDLHYRNRERLPPLAAPLDRAFSALLDDLEARGLLDETLVVWMGEFGRAPLIEREGGRGHWGRCYSVVLAGAGIRPGMVHGRSDRRAAFPIDGAVSPQDLVTTIYHCLGIGMDTELTDALGRPLRLCQGEVIRSVLA
ncbi:MAG: DUF1501 domain-containing protein [Planctomycetes bacterium]|nr:DUF1501 domain-containing protein [Planctomycetota bacterium]